MLNEGIFDMQKFVDGGWVTGLRYEDEVMDDLKTRTGGKKDKLRSVSCNSSAFARVHQTAYELPSKVKTFLPQLITTCKACKLLLAWCSMTAAM